jgi:hypothetical protein
LSGRSTALALAVAVEMIEDLEEVDLIDLGIVKEEFWQRTRFDTEFIPFPPPYPSRRRTCAIPLVRQTNIKVPVSDSELVCECCKRNWG